MTGMSAGAPSRISRSSAARSTCRSTRSARRSSCADLTAATEVSGATVKPVRPARAATSVSQVRRNPSDSRSPWTWVPQIAARALPSSSPSMVSQAGSAVWVTLPVMDLVAVHGNRARRAGHLTGDLRGPRIRCRVREGRGRPPPSAAWSPGIRYRRDRVSPWVPVIARPCARRRRRCVGRASGSRRRCRGWAARGRVRGEGFPYPVGAQPLQIRDRRLATRQDDQVGVGQLGEGSVGPANSTPGSQARASTSVELEMRGSRMAATVSQSAPRAGRSAHRGTGDWCRASLRRRARGPRRTGVTPSVGRPVRVGELVQAGLQQGHVAAELVDHEARDQLLVFGFEDRDGAEQVSEHAAAVDIADHQDRESRRRAASPMFARSVARRLISAGEPGALTDHHVEFGTQRGQFVRDDVAQLRRRC